MKAITYLISITYLCAVVMFGLPRMYNTDYATKEITETPQKEEPAEQVVVTPKKETNKSLIAKEIAKTFPEEPKVMVAIALAESGLNPYATGYNCKYTNEQGKSYIWACKKEDRHKAISTDGNVLQQNGVKGGGDIKSHLQAVRIIYEKQGKGAWTVYRTGVYKSYLHQAEILLASNQ